jgi:ribokinase
MSANRLMDREYVDGVEEQIARSDIVLAVLEIPPEAAGRAMELGRKHGVCTLLNPAPAQPLPESILRHVDYLTPNETELRILLGLAPDDPTPTHELARQIQHCGVKTVIVTMGEKGALILDEGSERVIPAISVPVVDTTGAGDAFNAGLAMALAEGRPLDEAVNMQLLRSHHLHQLGVIEAMGSREAVDQTYAANYGRLKEKQAS